MTRTLGLIVLLSTLPLALEGQAPGGPPRTVTVVLAGPALSGGAAQEGLALGIPWRDFADQLFPSQNVRIRMEYFWRWDKIVPVVEDVGQRGFDYERAKFLFAQSGFFDRPPRFVVIGDFNRPEVKRAAHWLRDQLKRLNLDVDDYVRDEREFRLENEKADAMVLVRSDK